MSSKKKKYYVVWQGHEPGVYDSWAECQQQVKGFPNAKYKAFKSRKAAKDAFIEGADAYRKSKTRSNAHREIPNHIESNALSVDAACSGNPGIMEYRGVWIKDGTELFRKGPFKRGTNNIGEFLAIVHAAALLDKQGYEDIPIYTDSRTALAWVRKKKVNTKLKFDRTNHRLKKLVMRAENWLKVNDIPNPLKKWNTKNWGEIPADFGRK
jgi:ribonuclease HI